MPKVSCLKCGRGLRCLGEHRGQIGRCPDCGHTFQIPVADALEPDEDEPLPKRRNAKPANSRMGLWIAGSGVTVLATVVGLVVFTQMASRPAPVSASSAAEGKQPPQPATPPVDPDRYDGEWAGVSSDGHRVDGIVIDKNEFPCAGEVRMGSANVTASTPVLWKRDRDDVVATDNRPGASGDILARVRLKQGQLGGEATTPDGALFIPPGLKTFSGFKRIGSAPARNTPPAPDKPKPAPTPTELIVGKWSGKYPTKKVTGEEEDLDETWTFEKAGTFRRTIAIPGGTLSQEGTYRLVDAKTLELTQQQPAKPESWNLSITADSLVIAHPVNPGRGGIGHGTSMLRRVK
jgi:hypothetical protein